jgi:hypothetical protein
VSCSAAMGCASSLLLQHMPSAYHLTLKMQPFKSLAAKVTSSRRGRVKVLLMMFGHLREQELYVADVRVIN